MSAPWAVEPADVIRFQSRDVEFTRLVNSLLHAQAAAGLPLAAIRTSLKTDAPDGGVDAAVDASLAPPADPTGLFASPTCWQYKACPSGRITQGRKGGQEAALRAEVRKPHVRELLGRGYAYRLCIADSLTPDLCERWEVWLGDEARAVRPTAPPPVVLTADRLAACCSRYPGIVRGLRPDLDTVRGWAEWDRAEVSLTPRYVPVPARAEIQTAIRRHADLSRPADRAVLPVSGEAGVGKTRLVLEALRGLP